MRLDPALANQAAEGGEQLAVLKLPERQVDRHVQRRKPVFAQGLHVAQRPGNHPIAQRHNQPALFGQRHKLAGGQQATFAVTPAHQGFKADNLPGAQIQARLVMQLQLVAAQGAAQFAFKVCQAAGVAVDAFIEQVKRAALRALGLLHGDVRMPHQRIGPGVGARMGDTEAATDQQALAVNPVRFGQRFGDAFSDLLGAFGGAAGVDQQGEFVAAQSGQLIARLQLAFEPGHHLQDQAIPRLVPKGIVGVAKVVQVQMPEGDAAAFAFRQTHGQQGLKALAVGDAGQRVFFGQALQGVFEYAALANMPQASAQ